MEFQCKKTENCFSDSQTYEYRLCISAEEFLPAYGESALAVKRSDSFRRPFFTADAPDGTRIKGVLKEPVIKVSFPEASWEQAKAAFEARLSALEVSK